MRYLGIVASLILFSSPVFSANMTEDTRCETLGEVAEKATTMKNDGKSKEAATSALLKIYDQPGSGLTTKKIRAYVTLAYMMRMGPEKARDYATAQCKQGS